MIRISRRAHSPYTSSLSRPRIQVNLPLKLKFRCSQPRDRFDIVPLLLDYGYIHGIGLHQRISPKKLGIWTLKAGGTVGVIGTISMVLLNPHLIQEPLRILFLLIAISVGSLATLGTIGLIRVRDNNETIERAQKLNKRRIKKIMSQGEEQGEKIQRWMESLSSQMSKLGKLLAMRGQIHTLRDSKLATTDTHYMGLRQADELIEFTIAREIGVLDYEKPWIENIADVEQFVEEKIKDHPKPPPKPKWKILLLRLLPQA